jgi:hypothetical protein
MAANRRCLTTSTSKLKDLLILQLRRKDLPFGCDSGRRTLSILLPQAFPPPLQGGLASSTTSSVFLLASETFNFLLSANYFAVKPTAFVDSLHLRLVLRRNEPSYAGVTPLNGLGNKLCKP